MTGKNIAITTILVLACFAAALVAFNYLDPNSISSFVSSSAPVHEDAVNLQTDFEVEGKHHNKHHKNNLGKHKQPAPVRAGSSSCFSVNADALNVRDAPCGNKINTLSRGQEVTGVGGAVGASGCSLGSSLRWQQISSPVRGYVTDSYLVARTCSSAPKPPPAPTPTPPPAPTPKCYTVNADSLNVRSSPCGNVAGSVSRGTQVTAVGSATSVSGCSLGSSLRWQQITSPVSGYVSDSYLVSCGSTPTPTPPPSGSGPLSLNQLIACMPGVSTSTATLYLPYLNSAMREGDITSPRRMAAFLAQIGHESGSLVYMEEIASGAAYEGRRDLGNIYPGDGVRYKGRGPIQITGRANYAAAGQALGLDLINNPTQAATPGVGFRLAVWFWNSRHLSGYADQNTQSAFDTITHRINGGYNGKASRDSRWATCKRVLGA